MTAWVKKCSDRAEDFRLAPKPDICAFMSGADRTQPADLDSAGRLRASMDACRSRTNADDRLPRASLGRVQGGDGIVEGRDVADVRPQSSVTHPLDDLTQLGTI